MGIEPEHEHYREKVRRVLDAGMLWPDIGELDAEARRCVAAQTDSRELNQIY